MEKLPESVVNAISENKTKYEEISMRMDPYYKQCLEAIDIIKKFIADRGLVLYGGTAVDFALRLKGDKIYPDEELAIPDLDFYSPDNVKDAYDLADILYKAGFTEVRTIRATYVKTMRVDVGHQYLADITYVPPQLFKKIPQIEYEGMKMVHPNFQRMDFHTALAYPYDFPPREAIFLRWKFIKRLNLLDKYYPLPESAISEKKSVHVLPYSYTKYVFAGSAAYALLAAWTRIVETELENKLSEETKKFCKGEWKNAIALDFRIEASTGGKFSKETGKIVIETLGGVEFVNFDIDAMAEEIGLVETEKYTDIGSFEQKRIYGIDKTFKDKPCGITIYNTQGKYVVIGSIEKNKLAEGVKLTGSSKTRFVGSQYLLANFIGKWILTGEKSYLALYKSVMTLMKIMERIIMDAFPMGDGVKLNATDDEIKRYITGNPALISTSVYGDENVSETLRVSLTQLAMDLQIPGVSMPATPVNYYPARATKRKVPDFDYESSEFFIKDGRRLDKED